MHHSSPMPKNADSFDVPIIFLVFNRPEMTRISFESIRRLRPDKLFVVADGPRKDYPDDQQLCQATRRLIKENTDWPVASKFLFRAENLGCALSVSTGLDWVFEQVNEAIILEDDCVPDPSFFRYCRELLIHYQDDPDIFCISGNNHTGMNSTHYANSYFFTRYAHIWGWATWKRAWDQFDFKMEKWPEIRDNEAYAKLFSRPRVRSFWKRIFDQVYLGTIDTWDYRWCFTCLINNGLSINPHKNLVQNIGIGRDSTHTRSTSVRYDNKKNEMLFPLLHPEVISVDREAEKRIEDLFFTEPTRLKNLEYLMKRWIKKVFFNR